MEKPRAVDLIDLWKRHKGMRTNFESYWQSLHDYFYIEAPDINRMTSPGSELNIDNLYDATTLEAGDVLASGFMNYLTPPTSKWFALRHRNPAYRDNKKVANYLQDCTDEVNYVLNRSNYYNQMICNYKSSGVYGTSIMLEEEDTFDDARFYSMPIKQVVLVENARGSVGKFFIEFEYTAEQAAEKFGIDNLSTEMQQEARTSGKETNKHLFLLYIAERFNRDIKKTNKKNLPIEATWIDSKGQIIVQEDGYHEFPAFCHRFDKRPFIAWGYSPAMRALPFARQLNAVAKTNLRAMMKMTDPPIALPDNAFIMPFNANPRAVNYYNKTKMEASDIFAFSNYGNPQVGLQAVEYYSAKVKGLMYNDVFLAFDGITKQMNNPEIMERINEKMTMLGPAVGRYISEMINPTIIRTLGILSRKGKLPRPPEEIMIDPSFEIDCVSQLAQSQRRSELNALMTGLTLVGQLAPLNPNILDKISTDKVVDEAWNIIGATPRVLNDDDVIETIRTGRTQLQQQAAALQSVQASADAIKTGSEIDANLAKANQGNQPTMRGPVQ
jgi:hypothetical protein